MALELLSRRLATTTNDFIKGAEDAITRNRKLMALLRSRGQITYGHEGTNCDWGIEFRRGDMQQYTGSMTFAPVDRHKRGILRWGGYVSTDMIQKREMLINKGKAALIKVYSDLAKKVRSDIEQKFPDEIITADGNAAGSEQRIHGLESIFSISGAATNGYVGVNNDTYAGLSTAVGNYGGNWDTSGGNTIWPRGMGDDHYDFHTPIVVLVDNTTGFGTGASWANNSEESLRFGIDHSQRNATMDGQLDLILLDREWFRVFKDTQTSKERINVTSESTLYKLGFRDIFNFDGIDVTKEWSVPVNTGYGLSMGQMELRSLQEELLDVYDDYDHATHSHRFSCDFHGNLVLKTIRHFVKWRNT